MDKFWLKEGFKEICEKWYQEIKKRGFADIEEKINLPDPDLRNASMTDHEAVTTYFQIAQKYCYTGRFENVQEKLAWRLHAEGKSVPEIIERTKLSRNQLQRFIAKHRIFAGLRK